MTVNEIRQKYLNFYAERGHVVIPSASLIPEGDATTLFTGSGMQPLVPYLLGAPHPEGQRLTDSQKSFRAEDIDEVGDNRHTTFFEMLGNWSLGDYFKAEQLPWIFEFVTKELGLDPQRLYVTVFAGDPGNNVPRDDESVAIWKQLFASKDIEARDVELVTEERGGEVGMQGGRIFYYGNKNWWSRAGAPDKMPVGEPGGPDSEMFYEFTEVEHDSKFGTYCHPNCDCGRFLEIGNSVFIEYKKTENGFERLAQRNVDFGGGLERMAAAANGDPDVFKIDILARIMTAVEDRVRGFGVRDIIQDQYFKRIVVDHVRAACFLFSDGVNPSNKDRGYVLRKLIRRAYTAMENLYSYTDASTVDLQPIARVVVDAYSDSYPKLAEGRTALLYEIDIEQKHFAQVKQKGKEEAVKRFHKWMNQLNLNGEIGPGYEYKYQAPDESGEFAFYLESSHGLPYESFEDLATRVWNWKGINKEGYETAKRGHQELSRTASAGAFKGGLADHSEKIVRLHTATHLTNAALRKVLGDHVYQKGSNITEERTRFDFTHDQKMTDEQKVEVESLVNGWIERSLEVKQETMPEAEARQLGAIGVFGEKYPEMVSVYTVWDPVSREVISREFCGGPHVKNTSEIGAFKIVKEEASSAGVRRIKATIE